MASNFFQEDDLTPEVDQMGLNNEVIDVSYDEVSLDDFVGEQQQQEEVEEDADLSQVDQRLEVAMYYRELLRSQLFEDEAPAARMVVEEVRNFVKGRLGVLMGIQEGGIPSIQKSPFTTEEVSSLKRLAVTFGEKEVDALKAVTDRLVKKPSLVEEPPKQPTIRKVQTPAAVAPKPAPAPPPVAAKPVPKAKPQAAIVRKSAAAFSGKKPVPRGAPARPQRVLDENGNPVLKIGNKVLTVAESTVQPGKKYVKDITPAITNSMALPMPQNREQWEMMTADHAQKSVNTTFTASDPKNAARMQLIQNAAALSIASVATTSSEEERP